MTLAPIDQRAGEGERTFILREIEDSIRALPLAPEPAVSEEAIALVMWRRMCEQTAYLGTPASTVPPPWIKDLARAVRRGRP